MILGTVAINPYKLTLCYYAKSSLKIYRKEVNRMDREEHKIDRKELKNQIDELMQQYAQKMMELTTSTNMKIKRKIKQE